MKLWWLLRDMPSKLGHLEDFHSLSLLGISTKMPTWSLDQLNDLDTSVSNLLSSPGCAMDSRLLAFRNCAGEGFSDAPVFESFLFLKVNQYVSSVRLWWYPHFCPSLVPYLFTTPWDKILKKVDSIHMSLNWKLDVLQNAKIKLCWFASKTMKH